MERRLVTAGRDGQLPSGAARPRVSGFSPHVHMSGAASLCSHILLCRETEDCQDPEALQVMWESQAG